MRQPKRAVTLASAGVAALFATAATAVVAAGPAWAEGASATQDANVRAAPTTDSAVVSELAAGDAVEVVCWVTGEPTFGADQYGSMWLLTTEPGYVHSFLVTPVDVPECAGAVDLPPQQPAPLPLVPELNIEGPPGVYYDDCHEAVAMGTAPVLASENGYREDLDSDADGIGCEWIPEDS